MKGYLVLENGRIFEGKLLNDCLMARGEVVFTTAMISYQDIITDPSYYGQIVVMTYPLVGNVGFNEKSFASKAAMLKGLVLREATDFPSHYEMETDLISFLNKSEIAVLTHVDTRALTREIRTQGVMGGIITDNLNDVDRLKVQAVKASLELQGDLVQYVTRKNIMKFGSGEKRVVLLDLGTKQGVFKSLLTRGVEIIAVPATTTAEEIMSYKPDGLFISDGPGDPEKIPYVIAEVKKLIEHLPVFGIGLGHQVVALACGGQIKKLSYGHRGSNQPVRSLINNRIYITSQNHSYTVEPSTLPKELEIIMCSLNDGSIEGIRHKKLPVFTVQFDPEGYPGYSDTGFFFDDFVKSL